MGQVDKLIFTHEKSRISDGYVYHIQYVGKDNVPRYLGLIQDRHLQTALWFYNQELKMEIEIRNGLTSLEELADELGYDLDDNSEVIHHPLCPCNNADERGCFLISARTNKCVSCECEELYDA